MEELISVVVPIYNVEKYLQKCIDSILAQTYRHLEIILVDDGSPDNCGAICDNYAQEDGRVLVIHKKNGGLSSARNAGLEIAKGELIVFIDSDDWIDANYIEKLYDDISESGADVAVPAFCISFENGDCAVDSRVKEVTTYSKKEALEVFLFNEDQYTTYKLLMLANKIVFDPEVYYYYFKRSGSIGHSSFSKRTYDLLFGIGEQYQVITEAYPETTSTMKVARTVWELVFVNMMICSKYNDKETIGQVQKHARNAFLDVVTCKYLPAVRKAEIALFCFNFSAYRFIYIKYKSKKKIA